ncbi:hypothetical protein P7C70_g4400, partial [Phenoliferia sp. Uapishka_3]
MAYLGKTAIVTGGASGIGLGITTHLIEQGCRVVIADLNAEAGAKLVADFNQNSSAPMAAFCSTDVTSWASQVALFAFTYVTFGKRIDFFFANAGHIFQIAQMKEMRSSDPTHFASAKIDDLSTLLHREPSLKVIEVDLNAVLYSLHLSLAYFRQQEKDADGWRGKFVATGSNASFYPFPNDPLYGAAKSGVLGAVRAVGPRVLKEGITVNAFGPSVVATALAPPAFLTMLEKEGRLTPMKTITDACDIFIALKSKVTGQIVENVGLRNAFRAVPGYMDDKARANMNEFFEAGAGKWETVYAYLLGAVYPLSTCDTSSLDLQFRFFVKRKYLTDTSNPEGSSLDSLQRAIDCGACCMDVSRINEPDWTGVKFCQISPGTRYIGCLPPHEDSGLERIVIPRGTDARLFDSINVAGENTAIPAVFGVGQLVFSGLQLANATSPQVKYLGYGAPVFTIIPFFVGTTVNIVAAIFTPKFSGKIVLKPKPIDDRPKDSSVGPVKPFPTCHFIFSIFAFLAWIGTIYATTSGHSGRSAFYQRFGYSYWAVFGTVVATIASAVPVSGCLPSWPAISTVRLVNKTYP